MKIKFFHKVIFWLLIAFMYLMNIALGQTTKIDKDGNYYYDKKVTASHDSITGKKYKDYDNKILPVYRTRKGRLYVIRTSQKTGNRYRNYLKLENE